MAEVKSGYEKRDLNLKWVAGIAILSILILVVFLVLLDSFFVVEREAQVYDSVLNSSSKEYQEIMARDTRILNSYGYVDKEKGLVHIPIDKAMELLVKESAKK